MFWLLEAVIDIRGGHANLLCSSGLVSSSCLGYTILIIISASTPDSVKFYTFFNTSRLSSSLLAAFEVRIQSVFGDADALFLQSERNVW